MGDPDVPAARVGHEVGVGGAGDGVEPRPAAGRLDLVGEEGRVGRDGGLLMRQPGAAAADGDAVVNAAKEGICSREHEPANHTINEQGDLSGYSLGVADISHEVAFWHATFGLMSIKPREQPAGSPSIVTVAH